MITPASMFAGLLPVAVLSVVAPLSMQTVVAMQTGRTAPAVAKPAAPRTSTPVDRETPASRYLRGQVVGLLSRNARSGSVSSAIAATPPRAVSNAVMAYAFDAESSTEPGEVVLGTYGPAIGGDALGNNTVGGPVGPRKCFIRFRAEQSSPLVSVTLPFLSADYPGYGGGTGGEWVVRLHADDGTEMHFPAGPALASKPMSAAGTSCADKKIVFASPYATTAGELYHLVIENIDANPAVNYFSVNNWVRLSFSEDGSLNPRFCDTDWGNGYFHSGTWHRIKGSCPIADIAYANGAHQGMCYGEASYTCAPGMGPCSQQGLVGHVDGPTQMIRERFTVSGGDRVVSGFGVRLLRSADTTGDLVVSLRNGADEEIASAVVPASAVATGPDPSYSLPATWDDLGQKARWVSASFDDQHTLFDGETYSLRISSTGGKYWAWVIRRLTPEYAYAPETAFTDGWAEYTADGLTWSPLGRVDRENDLQFFLTTVESGGDSMDELDEPSEPSEPPPANRMKY